MRDGPFWEGMAAPICAASLLEPLRHEPRRGQPGLAATRAVSPFGIEKRCPQKAG